MSSKDGTNQAVAAAWTGPGEFEDVLDAARAGDELAFAALWRWLHPPLLRWLSVVAAGSADDVASEVWLSVTRGLPSFEGDELEFRGWLFMIARRRAVDWTRHRQRQPPVTALDGVDAVDPAAAVSALVEQADALDAALALLRDLTTDQREVLALRVIVGLTVRETAAVVTKTEGAVRLLCYRGLQTLARRLHADQVLLGAAP